MLKSSECDRVRAWVERVIRAHLDEEGGSHPFQSTYGRCLTELVTAAVRNKPDLPLGEDWRDSDVLQDISSFVHTLAMVTTDPADYAIKTEFWRHMHQPVWEVRHGKPPEINRMSLEGAVDHYLDLPVRAAYVDRLLVNMLIGCELVAYGRVVYGKVSEFERAWYNHVGFGQIAKGRAKSIAFWVALIVATSFASDLGLLSYDTSQWWTKVFFWLGVAEFTMSIALLPYFLRHQRRRNDKVLGPLRAINSVYTEMNSTGSVSTRHIRDQASKAADAGVGWPGPLFVLLDDVLARGGRL